MHLISPLISGVRGADSGYALIRKRATTVLAALYSSFEGDPFSSAQRDPGGRVLLDSYGRAEVYVNEICDVTVFDLEGQQLVQFTAGSAVSAIEVRSPAFTGQPYNAGSVGVGQPTTLQAVLDLWKTTHDLPDWAIAQAGSAVDVTNPIYGALGDGDHDDTDAFQAALLAAQTQSGVLSIPAGVYKITDSLEVFDVSLVGGSPLGPATLVLTGAASLQTTNARIAGLRIESTGGTVPLISVHGYTVVETCTLAGENDSIAVSNNQHLAARDCVFEGNNQTGKNYIAFSGPNVQGHVSGCSFQAQSSGGTAMALGAYGAGTRFYESDNDFADSIARYSYTASALPTAIVQLRTRDRAVLRITDNNAAVPIPTDQYGTIVVSSTNNAVTLTGTLPPRGARGTVLFYHPSPGGAGNAQPTTNFFGSTAGATVLNGTNAWEYVCGVANTALRMLVTVDGKALGPGAP